MARLLDDNPSLCPELQELIANTYIDAVLITVAEPNLDEGIFLVSCPFVWEQLMGEDEKQWD